MRVLDMSHPIGLNDIYTNVNILETITGRRRKGIAELLQECKSEDFERFGLGRITEKRVPGLEAVEKYTKLMIWGKPGAGKTTFLKYLAIQCNQGGFQAERVPIFVTLKDFAEDANKLGLLEYISQHLSSCGVGNTQVVDLFNQGRTLVLLDGLDEVREEDSSRVLKEIRDFSRQLRDNRFVVTCRIAAREYTFEKFTEVEIADFDDEQIYTFAANWFKNKDVKPATFIEHIGENDQIKELATNPLLLTLLCLVFEESGDFPPNRSELYKEGLDVLLKKWDAKRDIHRDKVYKKLSFQRKEDLLSQIALATFEKGDYFFKQKVAEQYIIDYIRNLPDANTEPEALQLDSEVVLHSIEAQHGLLVERAKGIYSFSHLTFHEYFTAREIILGAQPLEERLQNLASHINDIRWREVILLAVEMSSSADSLLLLMKERVDAIVADDKLQHFLMWVKQKSLAVCYKQVVVRVYYLCLEYVYNLRIFYQDEYLELADAFGIIDIDVPYLIVEDVHALDKKCYDLLYYQFSKSFSPNYALSKDIEYLLDYPLEIELKKAIQKLEYELPNPNQKQEKFKAWWKENRKNWCDKLRYAMIKYRNISHNWQFSDEQMEALKQYYDANLLLVECLNSNCDVSREVRQEIEDTLLLPIAEI
ncbi:MAG: NACHT domain-containing NTPase [Aphanothece sp. CMT-3BRIN-NPC111]|nr:NACHT domain-containing NTPase [Aphanothece sp. CMT-3BRIN-NPC111]